MDDYTNYDYLKPEDESASAKKVQRSERLHFITQHIFGFALAVSIFTFWFTFYQMTDEVTGILPVYTPGASSTGSVARGDLIVGVTGFGDTGLAMTPGGKQMLVMNGTGILTTNQEQVEGVTSFGGSGKALVLIEELDYEEEKGAEFVITLTADDRNTTLLTGVERLEIKLNKSRHVTRK